MWEEILEPFQIGTVLVGRIYAFGNQERFFLLGEKGTSIVLSRDLYEQLKSARCTEELLIKLIQRGLAQIEGAPEVVDKETEVQPNFFIITLTNNCNMRCKYCFHQFLPKHADVMPEDMLIKIIDYIIEYTKRNKISKIMIQAWGGEPLLCMDLLQKMHQLLNASGISYRICLETNGTLLAEEVVRQLSEMNIEIGISMDGIAEVQNKQRPLVNGKESFEIVRKGLRNLQNVYENQFGSITVVTKDVLEHLEECLDYFAKQDIGGIKLNIARVSEQQRMGLDKEEVEVFANRLIEKMIQLAESGCRMKEGNIVDRLKNLLIRNDNNICISHGCQGGKRMISFDTKGNIYPCEMTDYPEECLGNIDMKKDLIEVIESKLGQGYFAEKNLSACKDCPFLYYCGGGCTTAIIYQKGNVEGVDEIGCIFNKVIYRRLIQMILEKPELVEKMIGIDR